MVTTLGVFDFEPTNRRMRLIALHPGTSVEEVQANTGFDVLVSDHLTTTAIYLNLSPEAAIEEFNRKW